MKKEVKARTKRNAIKTETSKKAPKKMAMKAPQAMNTMRAMKTELSVCQERWRPMLLTQCANCNFIQEEIQLCLIDGKMVFTFCNEECNRCEGELRIKQGRK